jgi:hypothetical protein
MPATPPLPIHAYEPQFNAACKARLTAGGVDPAYSADDLVDLPAQRVVVEASGFSRASNHVSPGPSGRLRYDNKSGTVLFIITTPRTAEGRLKHHEWLGLVRELFEPDKRPLAGMPYQIMRFEETGGSITYIKEGERDRSELIYAAEIGIRPGT